jgi:cytochrome c-type biogenesis protein CcmF
VIVEIGHFALILALLVAAVQGTLPLAGAARGIGAWMGLAAPAALIQAGLICIAFAALTYAHVTSDFSVLNVINNSHSLKPMLYKVAGVWGNHEGSMVLWVAILALFGAAVAAFGSNLPPSLRARVLAVQGLIGFGFLLFVLFTSNPFERVIPAPIDGNDLNPLLQDPGLAFHPPFLYLGYVGFSMAFSFAVAALIEGKVDAAWARWVRPWTLAAWSSLTLGIAMGSWWAYYELGWGGWWFWDPVENASFMPWLAGTALLHSAVVVEKRDTLKGWTIFLAILTFALSLLGTFLVRSGVLTSVHAFATDPTRGVFILGLLVIVIGGAFTLFALRGPSLRGGGLFQPISREGALLFNNLLLCTAVATILLGTLYPLLLDAVSGAKISVGAPFFNSVFVPIMVPLASAMAIGPLLTWKRSDMTAALGKLKIAGAAAAVVVAITWWIQTDGPLLALLGMALATWLFVGALVEMLGRARLFTGPFEQSLARLGRQQRSSWGMTVAHMGMAIVIAGVTGSSAWKQESIQAMKPGDAVTVGGYTYVFGGAVPAVGPNYRLTRATFTVTRDGEPVAVLHPENRFYPVQGTATTEAAIRTTLWGDLYAVVGDPQGTDGTYVTRLYFNPLVAWIWLGALTMVLGGLLSLSDRRHRVGAPTRRATPADAPASAPAPIQS